MTQEERGERETLEAADEDDRTGTPRSPELPKAGDLVLRDEKGDYFWIKKAEYKAWKISPSEPTFEKMTDQMRKLIGKGVLLADVPRGGMGGAGFACVLINLAGIRRP